MTSNIHDIRGVIFDLGSTLIEYENIPWDTQYINCLELGYEYLLQNGYSLPAKEVYWVHQAEIRFRHRQESAASLKEWSLFDALKELLDKIGLNPDPVLTENYFEVFYGPIREQLSIFDDTIPVLNEIKRQGIKIGLVSNTIFPEEYHLADLRRFNIEHFFDFTIFSVSFGYRKPHPLIYRQAIDLIKLPPENLLFVGDRFLEDVAGPKEVGMKAILKFRKGRDYPQPLPADILVVNNLEEILPFMV